MSPWLAWYRNYFVRKENRKIAKTCKAVFKRGHIRKSH